MKTSTTIALALATVLSGSLAAYAQTEQPTPYHHYHVHRFQGPPLHHHVVHHFVAHNPARVAAPVVVAPPPAVQALPPLGLAFPHIAPYPDGKGDEDGLSGDENDCAKGCIDGNTSD